MAARSSKETCVQNQLRTILQGNALSQMLTLSQATTQMTNLRGANQNMERVMTRYCKEVPHEVTQHTMKGQTWVHTTMSTTCLEAEAMIVTG